MARNFNNLDVTTPNEELERKIENTINHLNTISIYTGHLGKEIAKVLKYFEDEISEKEKILKIISSPQEVKVDDIQSPDEFMQLVFWECKRHEDLVFKEFFALYRSHLIAHRLPNADKFKTLHDTI